MIKKIKAWLFPEKIVPQTLESLPGVEIEEIKPDIIPHKPQIHHTPVLLKYLGKRVFGFFFYDDLLGKIMDRDTWEEIDLEKILEYLEDPVRKDLRFEGRKILYKDKELPREVYWWGGKLWNGEKEWLRGFL